MNNEHHYTKDETIRYDSLQLAIDASAGRVWDEKAIIVKAATFEDFIKGEKSDD